MCLTVSVRHHSAEAELLGGEQSGTGEQPAAYGGACRFRVGEAGSGGGGEGDGGERAGLVERDERLDGDAGCIRLDRVQAVGGRHEQYIGCGRVGDRGDGAVQGAGHGLGRRAVLRGRGEWHG